MKVEDKNAENKHE